MMIKLLKRFENIVANGEIAHYEQFLHLPHSFQKSTAADTTKCMTYLTRMERVAKGEIAHDEQIISPFVTMFSTRLNFHLWRFSIIE